MNHPVTSMIRCPPLCEYTLSPSFETGTMLDAARVWPDRSVLSSDASGNGEPAGMGGEEPRCVGSLSWSTLIASAMASAGTPGGRRTMIDSPAASGRPKLGAAAVEHPLGGDRHVPTRRRDVGGAEPSGDVDDDVRRRPTL